MKLFSSSFFQDLKALRNVTFKDGFYIGRDRDVTDKTLPFFDTRLSSSALDLWVGSLYCVFDLKGAQHDNQETGTALSS